MDIHDRFVNSVIKRPVFRLARFHFAALPLLIFLAIFSSACSVARLAVYSRPGGAEVYVNDQLVARTVNEVTPIRIDVQSDTTYKVRVVREDYEPWERMIVPQASRELVVLADLTPVAPPPPYVATGTLEIRTDPGGARLRLNGAEIGYTKAEALEPVRVENLSPGSYLVKIDRDGFQASEERFTVFTNVVTRATIQLFPLKPYYVFPSNDDLLRQTVLRAVRGAAHLPGMRSNRTVAMVSLDGDHGPAADLRPLIEDALVAELAQNGRAVAEREDHLLVRMANEAARGDTLVLDVLTHHGGPNQPFIYDARMRTSGNAAVLETHDDSVVRRILVRDLSATPEARIPTADQVLGYRVVEKTLRVDPVHEPHQVEPMLRRETVLRIFLRLLDARTGVALWAERFEASLTDQVPERVYRWLERPPSRFYAYASAGARGDPTAPPVVSSDTEEVPIDYFTPSDLERLNDDEALFWYYRNIGESYLRADRLEDAQRLLREAVALKPRDYESRMFLGEALLRQNKIDAAATEYLGALSSISARP